MRNHRKLKAIRSKFKAAGYGTWCMFLEHLTASEDNYFLNSDVEVELLAGDFDVLPEFLSEVLSYCVKIELLNEENGKIWSKNLDERLTPVYLKRNSKNGFRSGNSDDLKNDTDFDQKDHFLSPNNQNSEENEDDQKDEKLGFRSGNQGFRSGNNMSGVVSVAESTQSRVEESKVNKEKKYIKKENFSDFSGKENSLGPENKKLNSPPTPSPEFFKKTKINPNVERSLKKLDKAGSINLAEIEEKFFPGQGTQTVILEFQKHFAKIDYKWHSDQATLGCFGPWTNQLRTKTISAQLDAKIPEKPNLSDKQEAEYAKFLKIRHSHGEIANFLNLEPSEEKESLIKLLIAKYGLSKLIRKIYEYSIVSTIGSTYNSISHFKAWEPNLKIPDKEWEEIIKGQELEEALKN